VAQGADQEGKNPMSGPDTIKGIGYQNAYTLYRLLQLLDEKAQIQMVTVEGSGEDIEDLTVIYANGSEDVVQVKKRETREGPYGLWGLADIKPIVAALYRLPKSKRNIVTFRFVATGNAHPRVIAIQKACQRLREGIFAPDQDGRAVTDVCAMIGASEEQARDFMRHLWLDVPMETEAHFEDAVQNRLMRDCGVPPDAAVRVYNDLYKRVLDKGKQAEPKARVITREELLGWLEEPRDLTIGEAVRVKIRQQVHKLRGRLLGAEVGEMTRGTVEVDQELDTVVEGGEAVGFKAGQMSRGTIKTNQKVNKVDSGGAVTGVKIDKL
jgi:hypothetical protein